MNNEYKDAYFGKSFMMIGLSTPICSCFRCSYCRANDSIRKRYLKIPEQLNWQFQHIPVAVNCFYGDPMIQIDNTIMLLNRLERNNHQGPVIIITKGNLNNFAKRMLLRPRYNLDIHFGLSTFGCDSKYDGGSMKQFEENMDIAANLGYHYSVEFRPIINGINDSEDVFYRVAESAAKHQTGIGYCGLQMNDSLRARLTADNIEFKPYDGHQFGLKKYVGRDVDKEFRDICHEMNVPVFRKTSCLIAWKHGLSRDPNAHYYRPNEVGCKECPMYEKCQSFKNSLSSEKLSVNIPFDYEIVEKTNHECGLFKLGVCKFPSDDCRNISGKLIKIDDEITTTDVRLIKWLTGYTVDAKFVESPYCSDVWIEKKKRSNKRSK